MFDVLGNMRVFILDEKIRDQRLLDLLKELSEVAGKYQEYLQKPTGVGNGQKLMTHMA